MSSGTLVLLDRAESTADCAGRVAFWSRLDVPAGSLSIPRLVHDEWQALRTSYLDWIAALGHARIGKRRVVDRLRLIDGLSLWPMGLIAEASPMKTPAIWCIFKLRALERLCERDGIAALRYSGADPVLLRVLADWCRRTGRRFSSDMPSKAAAGRTRAVVGRRVARLPHPVQGLLWLFAQWWRRARPVRRRRWLARRRRLSATPRIAIATYFPNVDQDALAQGRFRSHYWGAFHDVLDADPRPVDWIWLYTPSQHTSLAEALDHRERLAEAAAGRAHFWLLEDFIGPAEFLRILLIWGRCVLRGPRLADLVEAHGVAGSALDLRPVIEPEWRTSTRGIVAAEAAWYAVAFDAVAKRLPPPDVALFVFENQPWEKALAAAWHRHRAGPVIAHQHEAVKPLNLRLFAYGRAAADGAPMMPDTLAVGSEGAYAAFIAAGFPAGGMRMVESLRFHNSAPTAAGNGRALLVVTGYLAPETRRMLDVVAAAGPLAGVDEIIIKPHPFLPVEPLLAGMEFPVSVAIRSDPLERLWPAASFVFVANSTAAVFDALAAGCRCAVCAPEDDFNLSPALGLDGVPMVDSGATLLAAMADHRPPPAPPQFIEDAALPRWRSLLSARTDTAETSGRVSGAEAVS